MSNKEITYQEAFKNMLIQLFPNSKLNGAKTELMIPCPFCNKEGNHDHGKHMYISLGYNDRPPQYNCFRNSNHHGLLTKDILEQMTDYPNLIDINIMESIEEFTKKNRIKSRYTLNNSGKYNISIKTPEMINEEIDSKIYYINDRLGLNLSLNELIYNKAIFNIKELLANNNIRYLTRSEDIIDLLDKYFVGFLNNTNTYVILRNMVYNKVELPESISKRYVCYATLPNTTNIGYYTIPSVCDVYKHIDIHIAEGMFDILSIFYNLREANRENNIYSSIGGNTYLKTIQYYLETMGLIDIDFHIYIDNDIDNKVLEKIKQVVTPLQIPVYIHINNYSGEKDFGVPKKKIIEYSYRLC